MHSTTPEPDNTIDLTGLRCPHLVVATNKALSLLEPGQVLQVITTDINSPSRMSVWSRQSGHNLLDMYSEDDRFVFFLECRVDEGFSPDLSAHLSTGR